MSTAASRFERDARIVEPPEDPGELLKFVYFLEKHPAPVVLLGPDGGQMPLPFAIDEVLRQVATAMDRGASVSVEPIDRPLTTQPAAELLGVSRSTLVRLLDDYELPFEHFGESRHHRLRLKDVLAYRERKMTDRRSCLDELTRQANKDGLYDVGPNVYREALTRARKS